MSEMVCNLGFSDYTVPPGYHSSQNKKAEDCLTTQNEEARKSEAGGIAEVKKIRKGRM